LAAGHLVPPVAAPVDGRHNNVAGLSYGADVTLNAADGGFGQVVEQIDAGFGICP
jgi:hypothetical protein